MEKKNNCNNVNSFKAEKDISRVFSPEECIRSAFKYNDWESWTADEIEGLFGIPDHLSVFWKYDKLGRRIVRTFAFEMKREKWRHALMQAYRYASFADYSFVVLDNTYVHRALSSIQDFKKANIGLISVTLSGEILWHFRPKFTLPYSKHMRRFLLSALDAQLFEKEDNRNGFTIKWKASSQSRKSKKVESCV
jgi:hypothetical protein